MTGGAGRAVAALLCGAALAGCAASGAWTKPGADPAEAASAYQDCRSLAAPAMGRDEAVDQDIFASRGADAQRSAAVRTDNRLIEDTMQRRGAALVAACMRQKGFVERR